MEFGLRITAAGWFSVRRISFFRFGALGMKELLLSLGLFASSTLGASPAPVVESRSLDEVFDESTTIVFGYVRSIQVGKCNGIENVYYAELELAKTIRGESPEEKRIRVCSPGWVLPGRDYLVAGTRDAQGNIVPAEAGIILSGGRCHRFYRLDQTQPYEIEGEDGALHFSVGKLIPGFLEEYGQKLGVKLEELVPPVNEYICD